MTKPVTLAAAEDDHGRRLDRALRKALPDLPLSALHRLLRKGRVLVDGIPEKGACRVQSGALIQVFLENAGAAVPAEQHKEPNLAPNLDLSALRILWEDEDFLVLDKPAGLAVHGADSLETLARSYLAPKLSPSLSFKPGPLHRLDRPVSGVVVFSKTLVGARSFSALLRERRLRKSYLALLEGALRREETWADPLMRDRKLGKTFIVPGGSSPGGGDAPREALTRVFPLARSSAGTPGFTLVRLEIDTGRTHQIRAQASAHGHPLAGDRKYGGAALRGGLLLHAHFLELPGQALPGLPRRLEAPLPERFRKGLEGIFGAAFAGSL
jgi:23S rRNA pseudouridine955/2504/2580 synthase